MRHKTAASVCERTFDYTYLGELPPESPPRSYGRVILRPLPRARRVPSGMGQYRPVISLRSGWGRWIVLGAVLALVAGGAWWAARSGEDDLADLERAERSGERAQSSGDVIADNLDRLAENLEAGSRLAGQSEQIGSLTERQQRSLEDLSALLEEQLAELRRTAGAIGQTSRSSQRVAELSEAQAAQVRAAVGALRRMKAYAAEAGASSADLARKAVYGARLAEDSERSFSR